MGSAEQKVHEGGPCEGTRQPQGNSRGETQGRVMLLTALAPPVTRRVREGLSASAWMPQLSRAVRCSISAGGTCAAQPSPRRLTSRSRRAV